MSDEEIREAVEMAKVTGEIDLSKKSLKEVRFDDIWLMF